MPFRLALFGTLMAASYILSLLGFWGTGIIIDDHYVFASKEAEKKMDKRAYHLQSAIIFLCLGTMFLSHILRILSGFVVFSSIACAIGFTALIYAIVSHYAIRKKQ